MNVRVNSVASARRHLPCLAFACNRTRGYTICLPEYGLKKVLKISLFYSEAADFAWAAN